jgi:hypothetical protein
MLRIPILLLAYAGLSGSATLTIGDAAPQPVKLDSRQQAAIEVTLPARSATPVIVSP